jgi:hypothetical protein
MKTPRFVTPDGRLVPQAEKIGLRMGNRGKLGPVMMGKPQPCAAGKPWITCILAKNGKPLPKTSVKYTRLFFLDEVTALAAGHRPCGQCQTGRYAEFANAWMLVTGKPSSEMDANLASERQNPDGSKKTYDSALKELPSGAMFLGPEDGQPYLVFNGDNFRWTTTGYEKATIFPAHTKVQVLTPRPIVDILVAGFPLLTDEEECSFHRSLWRQP